ncbi:MAG: hypothetical protein ABR499_06740 [Gemmatimonadaceae bacterium]
MIWSVGRAVGMTAFAIAIGASLVLVLPPTWFAGAAGRATTWRRRARWTALVSGLVGWALAPFWAIRTGIEPFDRYADPAYAYIAQEAYQAAWMHNDNPVTRLALPAARVRRVWRDPAHCPPGEPGGREPYADWRAEVRYYTYFGIPGPLLRVSCGGWAW